jgi:hypothetical protein
MQLGTIDRILTQQALLTGAVQDGLTERPTLSPPTITLLYQTPPGESERYYPLRTRVDNNGRFLFFGNPATAFPRLTAGSSLDLMLRVTAPRYQTQEIPFSLSDADLMLNEEEREIDGRSFTLLLLDAPLFEQTVALLPEPLHLNGRIVMADEPDTPLANATVSLLEPEDIGPFTTNTDGYFTIYDLPVVTQVRLHAQHPGFDPLDTHVTLDYRRPVNQMTFALRQSNGP